MTDPFPFQVGDKVRLNNWVPDSYVIVDWIGRFGFAHHIEDGREGFTEFVVTYKGQRRTWSRYEPPVVYPEVWINIYPTVVGCDSDSRAEADLLARGNDPRIGVLHLRSDGTTEMLAP